MSRLPNNKPAHHRPNSKPKNLSAMPSFAIDPSYCRLDFGHSLECTARGTTGLTRRWRETCMLRPHRPRCIGRKKSDESPLLLRSIRPRSRFHPEANLTRSIRPTRAMATAELPLGRLTGAACVKAICVTRGRPRGGMVAMEVRASVDPTAALRKLVNEKTLLIANDALCTVGACRPSLGGNRAVGARYCSLRGGVGKSAANRVSQCAWAVLARPE